MSEAAVANASPLILLARAGYLDLLRVASGEIIVPAAVEEELHRGDKHDKTAEAISQAAWIKVVPMAPVPAIIQAWDLGPGESGVLAWAMAHQGCEAFSTTFLHGDVRPPSACRFVEHWELCSWPNSAASFTSRAR